MKKIKEYFDDHPKALVAFIVTITILVCLIIYGTVMAVTGEGKSKYTSKHDKDVEERDKIMSSYDWGDDYYYDTHEHKVKKYLF